MSGTGQHGNKPRSRHQQKTTNKRKMRRANNRTNWTRMTQDKKASVCVREKQKDIWIPFKSKNYTHGLHSKRFKLSVGLANSRIAHAIHSVCVCAVFCFCLSLHDYSAVYLFWLDWRGAIHLRKKKNHFFRTKNDKWANNAYRRENTYHQYEEHNTNNTFELDIIFSSSFFLCRYLLLFFYPYCRHSDIACLHVS